MIINAKLTVLAIVALSWPVYSTLPSCHVAVLNEDVPFCKFSSWLQWKCGRCGGNLHGNHVTTVRKRALCCSAVNMASVTSCLAECHQQNGRDQEVGNCVDVCPKKATPIPTALTSEPSRMISTTSSLPYRLTVATSHNGSTLLETSSTSQIYSTSGFVTASLDNSTDSNNSSNRIAIKSKSVHHEYCAIVSISMRKGPYTKFTYCTLTIASIATTIGVASILAMVVIVIKIKRGKTTLRTQNFANRN